MRSTRMLHCLRWPLLWLILLLLAAPLHAASELETRTITDRSIDWPSWQQWQRVLTLQDYNTRIVVLGTTLLGLASGLIGSFMLLRKRALMGDALSHATLPGIALAFIIAVILGSSGKSLSVLLTGAVISGVIGVGCILFLRHYTRLKEDTALGIVLSVFFGAGVAVLGIVQQMATGHAAGLESFIYGKTASMIADDALLIGAAGLLVAALCFLLYKELKLLCFDAAYARSQGWPILWLDLLLMAMVVTVTVIGLQAVGLILIISLLIIPPAAARFWTEHMLRMVLVAALIGAFSSMLGAGMSALFPKLPSGAMIVVIATAVFGLSMLIGPARGVLHRWLEHHRLSRRIARQHLLRALYEWGEVRSDTAQPMTHQQARQYPVTLQHLLQERSWSPRTLGRTLDSAARDGLVARDASGAYHLTEAGLAQARRMVRNHRLWETFLINFADVAPSHVDRDADMIEHVLSRDMVHHLEELLDHPPTPDVPSSPHPMSKPA